MSDLAPILQVQGLSVSFPGRPERYQVLRDVSFDVPASGTLCILGESGSGKSVTALTIMGLLGQANGRLDTGSITFDGNDLARADGEQMRRIRGRKIAMVFQEPMTSLNPVFTIGDQIMEGLRWHDSIGRVDARKRALEMLQAVGIPAAERRLNDYPHQLSGGMRQRVMIAMALIGRPRILIADEPTTALDVTVQAQILDLLRRLQTEFKMSLVLITHNMGIAADIADHIVVLYAGKKVEDGSTETILRAPSHPYTRALMECTPRLDGEGRGAHADLPEIRGIMPPLDRLPSGCVFAQRCGEAMDQCRISPPPALIVAEGHECACWLGSRGQRS